MTRGTVSAVALALLAGVAVSSAQDTQAFVPEAAPASSKSCRNGPLSRPRPGCAPALRPSTGSPYEDCVARINQLRWDCQCLPPLARWKGGEPCANKEAKHDSKHGPHRGFNEGICKPHGFAQNECPGWPSRAGIIDGCLQAMWDEGPGKRFSKHGHYLNMSNPNYERVACGFAKTTSGEVWSVQNFR